MSDISIILVIVFVICVWCYSIYASLIQKRNKVQEAFASIDVQLKKRYDLIPNILAIAKRFMEHERELFEDITKLRVEAMSLSSGIQNIDKKLNIENQIAKKMEQIIVAAENYPQLKSDQTMVTAMQTYNEVEEHISAARRFYNSAVNELKNAVEIFPSSFFAKILNIKSVDFFVIEEKERQTINAAEFLK